MVKNGGIRTFEAFLAFVFTFVFITLISSNIYPLGLGFEREHVLDNLLIGDNFRSCVLANDMSCVNISFSVDNPSFVNRYNYFFSFNSSHPDLPIDNVFVESVFISSNSSFYDPAILRLYYWVD